MTCDLALDRPDPAVERGGVLEQLRGPGEELLAAARQRHPGRIAREELDAELVLERLDLRGQRGLAQMEPLRRPGQVTELGDSDKASKLIELHGFNREHPDGKTGIRQDCCVAPTSV